LHRRARWQDLRRRLYVKAKAEKEWQFWGLYVHVVKLETLHAAYKIAQEHNGAPGIDGVTFAAIEAVGVKLRYLPTYSPDLNPIEMAVSKLKTALRKGVAHTVKALTKLIGKLIIWGGRSLAAGAPRRKALTHCGHRRVTEPYRMQYEL